MGEPRPRLALAAALLLAVGCTTDRGGRDSRGDDPLLGSGVRSGSQPLAVASGNPGPAQPAYQPKPPLTAATPTSNAALAGGFQPLPGSTDLRMGNGSPSTGTQPGFTDPRAGGSAAPTGFSPVTAVPPPGTPVNNSPPPPAAGPIGSLEQAYIAVAARNPLWTRLTYNGETREYLFQMKVPSRLNTSVAQTVDASGPSPTEAIRRALEQVGN